VQQDTAKSFNSAAPRQASGGYPQGALVEYDHRNERKGPYLGQEPPGTRPELFAPGVISTGMAELNSVFSPDGSEFYFCVRNYRTSSMFRLKMKNSRWTKPELLPFASRFGDIDLSVSPDGERLFFCSKRPVVHPDSIKTDHDIWVCQRSGDSWKDPVNLGPAVNSNQEDFFPTIARNGNLYFNSQRAGKGTNNIFVSKPVNGEYKPAEKLGSEINIGTWNFDPYIDPDERFLIFASTAAGGYGASDLYISFHNPDGTWTQAKNLGNLINTSGSEFSPSLSPDGKFFFYTATTAWNRPPDNPWNYAHYVQMLTSPGNDQTDIYWVRTNFLEALYPKAQR
jgi:Tol biopolymer transport system component